MTRRAERPASTRAATALGLALSVAVALAGCGAVPDSVGNQAPPSAATTDAPDGDPTTPAQPDPGGDATPSEPSTPQPPAPEPVSFRTNVTDGDGAGRSNVRVDTLVNVKAANGTLQGVTLSYVGSTRQGKQVRGTVSGAIDAAKTSWTAKERLEPSATYTLTVNGRGAAGPETEKSSFKTARLSADQETFASISPQTDDPVGIGMPVVLTFDVAVKDRKTFERNLHVQSSPAQEGSWSWLSNTQVRYRPKTWWKPGTTVKAWADINGLPAGNGVFGQKNVSTAFTVSKTSLVVRVNLKSHQAKVYIDDKLRRTIPISAGKSGWETRSGTKLIMGKRPLVRMTGTSIGIRDGSPESFDLDVRWAMQITASGEYMHAAPWNGSRFGRSNGSHGCVGMSTANAKWLYDKVRPGDPTITTGSSKELYQGNGYAEWNISYREFTKGSAL
jgi:lipoprotein-anchoring transpeptidase ErfK/SrfK